MAIYLSVFGSLSKSSLSSRIEGGPKVSTNNVTPFVLPEGVKMDES